MLQTSHSMVPSVCCTTEDACNCTSIGLHLRRSTAAINYAKGGQGTTSMPVTGAKQIMQSIIHCSWLSSLGVTDGGHSHQQTHDARNSPASFSKTLEARAGFQLVLSFDVMRETHAQSTASQPWPTVRKFLLFSFSGTFSLYKLISPSPLKQLFISVQTQGIMSPRIC